MFTAASKSYDVLGWWELLLYFENEMVRELWGIEHPPIEEGMKYLQELFGDGLNLLVIDETGPKKKRGPKRQSEKSNTHILNFFRNVKFTSS